MIRIYHNARCSKSRAALTLLEQHGEPLEVIRYLETPFSADELRHVLKLLGIRARALLRTSEALYTTLKLDDLTLDDEAIIAVLAVYPVLIERPIVVVDHKAVIGRPPEKIRSIL